MKLFDILTCYDYVGGGVVLSWSRIDDFYTYLDMSLLLLRHNNKLLCVLLRILFYEIDFFDYLAVLRTWWLRQDYPSLWHDRLVLHSASKHLIDWLYAAGSE